MASDIITSFFVGFIAPIPLCAIVGVFLSFKKVTRSALVEDRNTPTMAQRGIGAINPTKKEVIMSLAIRRKP